MRELLDQIEASFKVDDYKKTKEKIEEYFAIPGVGIYPHLLQIYIICLIRIGLVYTASDYIGLTNKLFPGYFNPAKLATLYSACHQTDIVRDIIDNNFFTRGELFTIAKECFYNAQYKLARKLFEKCLVDYKIDHITKGVQEFLQRIDEYEKVSATVWTNYADFKDKGNILEPGHIVYVRELSNKFELNRNNEDPKKDKRPYMVWQITEDCIYAFPLAKAKPGMDRYVLFHQHYPDCDFDRAIKDRLVVFEEKDIMRVVGKVNAKDYRILLDNMYSLICFRNNMPKTDIAYFMEEQKAKMNIGVNDVIALFDNEIRQKRLYFIISIDEKNKKYHTIEVVLSGDKSFKVVGNQTKEIKQKANILYKLNLSTEQITDIKTNIPANFIGENVIGNIVNYQGRKLQIMLDRKDYYLCFDRTIKGVVNYFQIEFIPKNVSLEIIEYIDNEEYEKDLRQLYELLKTYNRQIHQKEKMFTRSLKK